MSNVVRLPSASSAALQAHKLAPLLMPKRVALVGASPKEGTVGNGMIVAATLGEPVADIVLVNPNYPEIGARKAENVLATGATLLASANPGCTLHLGPILEARGAVVRAVHPIELLDQSIREAEKA